MTRRSLFVLLLIVTASALALFWRRESEPPRTQALPRDTSALVASKPAPSMPPEPPRDTPSTVPVDSPEPPAAPAAALSAEARRAFETELDNVQFALRDLRTVLKENPVGSNAEITKALLGDNLKQVRLPIPAGSSVNGEGQLCDRWGTPYFFHQLSGKEMEVRSAGPDRKMWTADDRQVK